MFAQMHVRACLPLVTPPLQFPCGLLIIKMDAGTVINAGVTKLCQWTQCDVVVSIVVVVAAAVACCRTRRTQTWHMKPAQQQQLQQQREKKESSKVVESPLNT